MKQKCIGINDAVYFYNQGVEVDFYIPDAYTAIGINDLVVSRAWQSSKQVLTLRSPN